MTKAIKADDMTKNTKKIQNLRANAIMIETEDKIDKIDNKCANDR